MPSKLAKSKVARSRAQVARPSRSHTHAAFLPLLLVCLLVWLIYRLVFSFPVWFDETIGKAIFFGLPVWLYISMTGDTQISDTFAPTKIRHGLLMGIAAGGLFGFAISFLSLFRPGIVVIPVPLFSSPDFWGEFILAILTGFWETLFFFSWIMVVIRQKYSSSGLFVQLVLVASIFVLFHIPNMILRTGLSSVVAFIPLLFIFALGQALLFVRNRNGYALVMSQAIWGMALLVHLR